MDQQAIMPIVLARIPDLRAVKAETAARERLLSRGRLFSQSLSFKLLAGSVLLLTAMAIVPAVLRKSDAPADPPVLSDTLTTWQSVPSTPPIAAAPTPAEAKNVVPIASELPRPVVADGKPIPTSATAPLMSSWPNPAHPTSVTETSAENPPARVNQAMAIRPSEHLRNSYERTGSSIH